MANTYNWKVVRMQCVPQVANMNDYVVEVMWGINGTDGEWTTNYNIGIVEFKINPTKSDYVPYDQLTEFDVLGWVYKSLGPEGVFAEKEIVDNQISLKQNPYLISPKLPWSN